MDTRLMYAIKRRGLNKQLKNKEIEKCNELTNPKIDLILI